MAGPADARTVTIDTPAASLRVTLRGEGPTVVMFPSLGRDVEDFDDLAGTLARAGYRTAAISPRGIGGSTGPLEGLTLRDLAGDVAATIDALGASPAHLIGHAFGNQVVRYTAAQFPDSVRSVTILAAGGKVMGEPEVLPGLRRLPRRRPFGRRSPRRDQEGALRRGQRPIALAERMVAGGGGGADGGRP